MARTAIDYNDTTTQWQVNGYKFGFVPYSDEDKLEKKINCSKKIETLLTNWFWNTIIAGGILLCGSLFVSATVLIATLTRNCVH